MVITPKFSIVIPVYNAEKYLGECVESVLLQSVTDFELILVDDGSTDESGHLCDRFALRDSRVRVIHQQNSGHITARMNGVSAAIGDYIMFMDSDDYWLDGALSTVEKNLVCFGCDMLVFRLRKGNENCHDFFGGVRSYITHSEYFTVSLAESGMNSLVIKAYARKLFENVDISAFSELRNSEDLVLSTMLAQAAEKISYIPEVIYYYRQNEGSITNSFNAKEIDEFIISRRFLWAELERLGLDNDDNKKVLYSGYLRRVSDWAYQASVSSMATEEKISHLSKVSESEMFINAMKAVDLSQFGKAKQLRLKLLYSKKYNTMFWLDKIKSKILR